MTTLTLQMCTKWLASVIWWRERSPRSSLNKPNRRRRGWCKQHGSYRGLKIELNYKTGTNQWYKTWYAFWSSAALFTVSLQLLDKHADSQIRQVTEPFLFSTLDQAFIIVRAEKTHARNTKDFIHLNQWTHDARLTCSLAAVQLRQIRMKIWASLHTVWQTEGRLQWPQLISSHHVKLQCLDTNSRSVLLRDASWNHLVPLKRINKLDFYCSIEQNELRSIEAVDQY